MTDTTTTDTTSTTTTSTTTTTPVAPLLKSAVVKNTKITLTFDSALDKSAVPAMTDFTLLVDGGTVAVHHFTVKGGTVQMFVTGTDKIAGGAVVTLGYTDPTTGNDANALQGTDGTDVATFPGFSVTNQGKVKPVKGSHGHKDSADKSAGMHDDAGGMDIGMVGIHADGGMF